MELEATESASGRLIRSRYAAVLGVGLRCDYRLSKPARDGVACRPIWVSGRSLPSLRTYSTAPSRRPLPTANDRRLHLCLDGRRLALCGCRHRSVLSTRGRRSMSAEMTAQLVTDALVRRSGTRQARCIAASLGSRQPRRIQTVAATPCFSADRSKWSSASAGVFQSSVLRGRELRAVARRQSPLRQMARHLRRNGWCVGRHRVRRLMLKMRLAPIYQRPKTSEPHPQHRTWPYLLRHLTIDRPNQVWCADVTYISMRRGFLIPGRDHGLVQSKGFGVETIEHDGC